ncbi:MAG TPA: hypothetical protein P5186_16365 [Candidatus Paceibacterota bacterium]|nr:hypothetical protein [Verrucomicrobiota bacterium]HRY49623.1 hypothetical protein [Candidatus Paceibacterota bacterium]HSA00100.1 hypothetical protein [Candidatus Paceibacterota bacterium]
MEKYGDSPLDRLWHEYSLVFRDFDDLTLARWMSQTLGQLQGRVWRLSHPLVGSYRLAAHWAMERQIWLKRLVSIPLAYTEAPCCRAPLLPMLTRDVLESGLICQHCSGTAVPLEDLPADLQNNIRLWAGEYGPVHAVAHWDEARQRSDLDYDKALDEAAENSEELLVRLSVEIMPRLLELFPAVVWEDQDECLEVRPEDIEP